MTATLAHQTVTEGLDALARALDGCLVRPGDPDWDDARLAWQLAVDQRPAAVVFAESAMDVVATVDAARDAGLRVTAQGTGHNAAPLGDLSDTVLIKTSRMRSVYIDPQARLARVEAGALWMHVTAAAAAHGLAALAGSSPDVGVVGYTLGGGLSWLSRNHGLAANSVVAVEMVTADGRLRRVDADHDPDLFWAVRGGGGNFGVVTALEFRLHPLREVVAGAMFFPIERADEVLQAWRRWLPTVPDTVASVGRLMNFPPLPELPPHLAGRSFAVLEVVCQLDEPAAATLLAPLRELGADIDTVATIPVPALQHLHMDPEHPVPGRGNGVLLRALPEAAVAAAVEVSAATGPALLSLELRHLGGALRPGAQDGGAVNGLDGEIALFAVGIAATPELGAAVENALDAVEQAMAPWRADTGYTNFAERRAEPAWLYGPAAQRLAEIKDHYDPQHVIRGHHPVSSIG
jgi:FAD/FMN-containing dehydrogenase